MSSTSSSQPLYIPLNTSESAVQNEAQALLPREVYAKLTKFIHEALERVPSQGSETKINAVRSHNAVSIDGERGTGKTSILVNLRNYLSSETTSGDNKLLEDIHILEPVDPTLLEDHESLFLHVIVAAVLSDTELQQQQQKYPDKHQRLNQELEHLAQGLESVERQNEVRGMDKLRALFGNKHLADCVQNFFKASLNVLGKKLLILPIDDVDTSLNRAFENLEIIRRYLTTPYVLPIVSGDRELYREITWRDFHGRLIKDSNYRRNEAFNTAQDLANEYQRKVLPLPRRLEMPAITSYLNNREITIRQGDKDILPLTNFYTWLEIYLSGPVNGLEGSKLPIPIPSIRALTQVINKCSELIPHLPNRIKAADNSLEVRRIWQMPDISNEIIEHFYKRHQELGKDSKRKYVAAYNEFAERLLNQNTKTTTESKVETTKETLSWTEVLADYFRYEPSAGPAYLVLLSKQYWKGFREGGSHTERESIFSTPLFQPLEHQSQMLASFEKSGSLSEWVDGLSQKLPEKWLSNIGERSTIMAYPVPEVGLKTGLYFDKKYSQKVSETLNIDEHEDSKITQKASLLIHLMLQQNFYAKGHQSVMLNIGRIFELIISSLVGPVSKEKILYIMQGAPFYSTSALAPTKTLNLADDGNTDTPADIEDEYNEQLDEQEHIAIQELVSEIETWREAHDLNSKNKVSTASPWMVYKVFNKVFSQVANDETNSGTQSVARAIEAAALTFYATWSAFGSFEKGRLFGLPEVVATVNLNSPYNFEKNDHFRVNIGPFAPNQGQLAKDGDSRAKYGQATCTISYMLTDHPLRRWLEELLPLIPRKISKPQDPSGSGSKPKSPSRNDRCKKNLAEFLKITLPEGKLSTTKLYRLTLGTQLKTLHAALTYLIEKYQRAPVILTLRRVIEQRELEK